MAKSDHAGKVFSSNDGELSKWPDIEGGGVKMFTGGFDGVLDPAIDVM